MSIPVYIIYSNWQLKDIEDFLRANKEGKFSHLRIDYDRNGKETNRTICAMTQNLYESLRGQGYVNSDGEISISAYEIRKFNLPPPDCTYDFYISVPKEMSAKEVTRLINEKILSIKSYDLIRKGDYEIVVPLLSREKGTIRGSCFVKFDKNVNKDKIIAMKILLDNTYFSSESKEIFRCYWAKEKKKALRNHGKQ